MMNGDVDDAACWIQNGKTRSGQILVHFHRGSSYHFSQLGFPLKFTDTARMCAAGFM